MGVKKNTKSGVIMLRINPRLRALVIKTADKKFQTMSGYITQAIVEALKKDGVV